MVFVGTVVLSIAGVGIASEKLLMAHRDPVGWVLTATAVLGITVLFVSPLAWRMKQSVEFTDAAWEFREREVELPEYRAMMREYRNAYSHLLARIDPMMTAMAAASFMLAILLPLVLARSAATLQTGPYVFGGFIVLFALLSANAIFKWAPNEASAHFVSSYEPPPEWAAHLLQENPKITWIGVAMKIGESSGYFVIREPKLVGRVRGIESASWIEISGTRDAPSIIASVDVTPGRKETVVKEKAHITDEESVVSELNRLVEWAQDTYIESRGLEGIAELLSPESIEESDSDESDDLISSDDYG